MRLSLKQAIISLDGKTNLGLWRYCHHFEELEIDALVAAACEGSKAREVARFSADGKSGAMNRYVVLQKR